MNTYQSLNINYEDLKMVAVDKIPKGSDAPTDNILGIFRLCRRMQSICEGKGGVGLSAVQIGIPINVCVVKSSDDFEYFVNCSYVGQGEKINSIEGCLSILGEDGKTRQFELHRFPEVIVKGYKLQFSDTSPYVNLIELQNEIFTGFPAIIMQHELDHAAGVLISDIGREIKVW